MKKTGKYRLVTETGHILLGGQTCSKFEAEGWWKDFDGIYEGDDTEVEERIFIEEVEA